MSNSERPKIRDMRVPHQSNLTQSQWLMWIGQQLAGEMPLYNMLFRFDFYAPIDVEKFRAAYQQVAKANEALGETYVFADGVVTARPAKILGELPFVDLSNGGKPAADAERWIAQEVRRPFLLDIETTRSHLLQLAPTHYVWLLNQHHIVTDAWTMAVVYHEVVKAYQGSPVDADEAAMGTYTAYREYERSARDGDSHRRARDHWESVLAGAPSPAIFYGVDVTRHDGAAERTTRRLEESEQHALDALTRDPGVRTFSDELTQFVIVATCIFAWMYRVSGATDLTLGVPAHHRTSPLRRRTAGLFTEVYPLRVQFDGEEETLASLARKVAGGMRQFLANSVPGSCDARHSRAFNVVLNFLPMRFDRPEGMEIDIQWAGNGAIDAHHIVRFHVHDYLGSGRQSISADVNLDIASVQPGTNVLAHVVSMLEAFGANAEQRISHVPIERPATLRDDLPPVADVPDVLDVFDEQVRAGPDRVALVCRDEAMSYQLLDRYADYLVSTLEALGVGRGDRVGLHAARSVPMVGGVMACLRVGAAFVPLEANLPSVRRDFIARDAELDLVLVDELTESNFADSSVKTLLLPNVAEVPDRFERASGVEPVHGDSIAYVLYTSGSTGTPKGVVVERDGLSRYIHWAAKTYARPGAGDFPLYSSIGFDLTLTSLFVPLMVGGRIVIYPESPTNDGLEILRVFDDDLVDVVKLTPAHLNLVLGAGKASSRVHTFILGGEDLKVDLARRALAEFGEHLCIANEYGPTEAIVGCMYHRFDPDVDRGASVPIGVAADDTVIHVLDAALNPVPDGVLGELCIGGPRLARGYLGRDDLTAERFVSLPGDAPRMVYRSGDLARRRPSGIVEYHGRNDQQLKIRGVRIEPAEIENALGSIDGIDDVAVTAIAPRRLASDETISHCVRCGLASNFPGITYDANGLCHLCVEFDGYRDKAQAYFETTDVLGQILRDARARRSGRYDCLMLLSGGKDSTYALAQLVAMGADVLAFTLDNGFISEGAKDNIRRVVNTLGVDHRFGATPAMDEIFADSLKRFSNVCQGCFKTIYTLGYQTADELGIPCIVTGLSRGQFFETRLTAELFRDETVDVPAIDRLVMNARKAYHRLDDAIAQCLDVSLFETDEVFERIDVVDFYRYTDVSLGEMLDFLDQKLPWVRPQDTGRSSNCLINDTGIFVHKAKEGFHNYALPYSWDVRLGHKQRDQALEELDDDIATDKVRETLSEIGYHDPEVFADGQAQLVAYYTASAAVDSDRLRERLAEMLPSSMVPSWLVKLEAIPLTDNGKVDRGALPDPRGDQQRTVSLTPPRNPLESMLAEIWSEALGVERLGIHDNFFELGGDSITAIRIVAEANEAGLKLDPHQLFETQTIAELATVCQSAGDALTSTPEGAVQLTPNQRRFFAQADREPDRFAQVLRLRVREGAMASALPRVLKAVLGAHDVFRYRFRWRDDGWVQEFADKEPIFSYRVVDDEKDVITTLGEHLNLENGCLVAAAWVPDRGMLHLAIHQLVVDTTSWSVVLDDLDDAWHAIAKEMTWRPSRPTSSFAQWSAQLARAKSSRALRRERVHWESALQAPSLPSASAGQTRAETAIVEAVLTAEATRQIERVAIDNRLSMQNVVLSALAEQGGLEMSTSHVQILLFEQTRPAYGAIEVGRTVGWFSAIYPVVVPTGGAGNAVDLALSVQRAVDDTPRYGLGFGLSHWDGEANRRPAMGGISFQYIDAIERDDDQHRGFEVEGPVTRVQPSDSLLTDAWDVKAEIHHGRLHLHWQFDSRAYQQGDMNGRLRRLKDWLQRFATAGTPVDFNRESSLESRDFPMAGLNQRNMDKLAAMLRKGKG
ncbi:MAG: amino acid adenylation domain-containing protein [Pseudomonadota bacterium]